MIFHLFQLKQYKKTNLFSPLSIVKLEILSQQVQIQQNSSRLIRNPIIPLIINCYFICKDLPIIVFYLMITDNEKSRMIQHFMDQVKTQDMINIGFMKPFEVALRNHKQDKNIPLGALPRGLMLAQKSSILDNKFKLKRFRPVDPTFRHIEQLRANNMDNYVSLLKKNEEKDEEAQRGQRMPSRMVSSRVSNIRGLQKQESERSGQQPQKEPKHHGMQIGICVSMKSEQRKLLKNTMKGVANNIDMIIRSGVSPDDIFVVVVIDGVRSVDKSLYAYFQELERESQIFLEEDKELTLRKKYENQVYHSQVEKDQPLNYSKFLFKKQEFEERINTKFVNVRREYDQVLRIKSSIANIKTQHQKDNDNLKMIVNRLADKQKNILKKINKGKQDKSIVITQDSIMKELANSQEECNQFISTRQDLAYVSVYRLPTTSLSDALKLRAEEERQKNIRESQMDSDALINDQIDRQSLRQSFNKNGRISSKVKYVNLFFCIKYKEAGQLNSHNWFFNGFCQELKPKYSFLVDVGIRPYYDSMFKMYRQLKLNPNVGGVCGYLRLIQELVEDEDLMKAEQLDCLSSCARNIFDIQRLQQIETHYDHILQKSFEGLFRFIHVVPGFFSGYNMNAIRKPGRKDELLRQYFRSIDEKISTNKIVPTTFSVCGLLTRVLFPRTLWKKCYNVDPDSQEQLLANENTYQAQNRILCLGIHKNNKDVMFMPDVFAQVQPIKRINDLMEHRKSEINGGVFSFEKVEDEFQHVTKKRESFLVRFQLFYLSLLKFATFFAPAFMMFTLQFSIEIVQSEFLQSLFATESEDGIGAIAYRTISTIILFIYAMAILSILYYSLHLDYQSKKFTYYAHLSSTILGTLTFISFIVFLVHIILNIALDDKSYIQVQFVEQMSTFLDASQAATFADILTYLIYAALVVMLLPSLCYACIFNKFAVLWEVVIGFPAYLFYLPTEFIILPLYAKCKLDDVYGKNSSTVRSQQLRQTWKVVKMLDVSKYLFWNIIVGMVFVGLLNEILLVKFFLLFFFLGIFILLSLIKWIPGWIFLIKYKCNKSSQPLAPSKEERDNNIEEMKLRIFDTIKLFQEDFTQTINNSFDQAAVEAENKAVEKQLKMEAAQKKLIEQQKNQKNNQEAQKVDPRGVSIALNNIMGVNPPSFSAKVQNIRQSSAMRPSFYPFQEGIAKKAAPPAPARASNLPLEMVLLKNQMGNEVSKNPDLKQGEQKLKKYQNFRSTIKPLGF